MLASNMKKIIIGPVFWGTVLIQAIAMLWGVWPDLQAANDNKISFLYCFQMTNTVGVSSVLMPILTVIPFAFFYVDELDKKTLYFSLIRSSEKRYLVSQIVSALFSGILVSAGAVACFALGCRIMNVSFAIDPSFMQQYFEDTYFECWMSEGKAGAIPLIYVGAFLLYSIPWGLICLITSLISRNKYIVIAAPFLLKTAVSYVTEGSPFELLNPVMTLLKGRAAKMYMGGFLYACVYHGAVILICSALYYGISRRNFGREGI